MNLRQSGPNRAVRIMAGWIAMATFTLSVSAQSPAEPELGLALRTATLLDRMNLIDGALETLEVMGQVGGPVQTTVVLNGVPSTLDLAAYSVRSPNFQVKSQRADGTYDVLDPGPVRTMRGTVLGMAGSVVAASLRDDGLRAKIILPDGDTFWVEPTAARLRGGAGSEHIVYNAKDVIPSGGTCIARQAENAVPTGLESTAVEANGASFTAELAIDTDVEFVARFGSTAATQVHIEDVVNFMNIEYIRDVAIEHVISVMILRPVEPDPYSTTNPNNILGEVRNHWRSQQVGTPRDMAELFTGKNLDGSVIGIAWVGAVCSTNLGYSVVQSSCCGSFACATDLSAHELGHNWSASHCGCPGWTMNPSINCGNKFHPTATIPGILSYRNTRTCLDVGPGFTCPIAAAPRAEAVVLATNRYLSFMGGNPGALTAVQVTAVDLPPPHDNLNGTVFWAGTPAVVSDSPSVVNPDDAPGVPTFSAARVSCDPVFTDWGTLGLIQLYGERIVPGGRYEIREANAICPLSAPSSFSVPLNVVTSRWGDVVSDCQTFPCGPPDNSVDIPTDVVSMIDKFVAAPGAPRKYRVDLEPALPDMLINITDITFALSAFKGEPYAFNQPLTPCP